MTDDRPANFHPAIFAVLYIVLMLFTYVLPFLGSNSALIMTGHAMAAGDKALFWRFWAHLLIYVLLAALCWKRGAAIDRKWLVIFPVLAGLFDLTPGLNYIPLIPTALNILAIILGVAVSSQPQAVADTGTASLSRPGE